MIAPKTLEAMVRSIVVAEVKEELRRVLEVAIDTGTATGGTTTTLVDTAKSWGADVWKDYICEIVFGTGAGQIRRITGNTVDTLTVDPAWTAPDTTSRYAIRWAGVGVMDVSTSLKTVLGQGANISPANPLQTFDAFQKANIGDFQAQTNLKSLLAALGIPDVAGKPLYTCLVTDRWDARLDAVRAAKIDNLDALISSRAIPGDAMTLTAAERAAIWAYTTRTLTDKTGFEIAGTKTRLDNLNDITAAAVWAVTTRALTDKANFTLASGEYTNIRTSVCLTGDPANSIGKILYDFYITRLTTTRTGYLDNLSGGAVALASVCTAARLGELDAANIPADIDIIKADTPYIADASLPASPTAGSLARFIATGGTSLGTQLPASKSLYDVIVLDRLDNATYGLSALNTDLDTLLARLTDVRGGYLDNLISGETAGTYNHPDGTTEQDAVVVTPTELSMYNKILLDLNALTQTTYIRTYVKVDGTNYRQADYAVFPTDFPTGNKAATIELMYSSKAMKVTLQSAVTEGAVRAIPYFYVRKSEA